MSTPSYPPDEHAAAHFRDERPGSMMHYIVTVADGGAVVVRAFHVKHTTGTYEEIAVHPQRSVRDALMWLRQKRLTRLWIREQYR